MPEPEESERSAASSASEFEPPKDRREFLRETTRSSISLLLAVPAGAAGVSLLTHVPGRPGSAARDASRTHRAAADDAPAGPAAPPPSGEPPVAAMDDLERLHAEFLRDNEDVVPYPTDASPTPPTRESGPG